MLEWRPLEREKSYIRISGEERSPNLKGMSIPKLGKLEGRRMSLCGGAVRGRGAIGVIMDELQISEASSILMGGGEDGSKR